MTRELLIFRHGKSDQSVRSDDYHRPLKDRGKRAAQRAGVWLAQQDLVPDHVISSPAERALVTAQKACKAMGLYAGQISKDKRVYAADLNSLLEVLGECPDSSRRVMLAGHNPGLEELLIYLTDGELPVADDGKLLPTAAIARLSMPEQWAELSEACAGLIALMRPEQLPGKFPFPDHTGTELRDRPAYYYTQSSVIPYRLRNGHPEILVILSSQKKHFVVPKGIKDPGLSPQDSAAKEAREEAGVEGRVMEPAIGFYRYEKWGAICTVDVYAMEVTAVVPEHEWQESHRGREWVSPEEAAERLKQKALAPMVLALAEKLRAD
ncbi:MAG: histidine phosphatase family protein [Pseudomonadota bacterium]|nr:histidine phosphatase family protein [Pseudomonadota bacterium]